MKLTKKYKLIIPIILLQIATNAWGMEIETRNPQIIKKFNRLYENTERFREIIKHTRKHEEKERGFPTNHNDIVGHSQCFTKDTPEYYDYQKKIVTFAKNSRIIYHDKVLVKSARFLTKKIMSGSPVEQKFYSALVAKHVEKPKIIAAFINRLIKKRPFTCYTSGDETLIYDPIKKKSCYFSCASEQLDRVGKENEEHPFTLKNTLSREETEIAALINLVGETPFINQGHRENKGMLLKKGQHQESGIAIASVGACYEHKNRMDCKYLRTEETQKDGDILITLENVHSKKRVLANSNLYFSPKKYKKRMQLSIESFLDEINRRGVAENKKIYLKVAGLGLGIWELFNPLRENIQSVIFLTIFKELLLSGKYTNIDKINFMWIDLDNKAREKIDLKDQSLVKGTRILFSQDNPAELLTGENEELLLATVFAWDHNSGVGNEFYIGNLAASGDPAFACCSLITSLLNPWVNHYLKKNCVNNIIKDWDRIESLINFDKEKRAKKIIEEEKKALADAQKISDEKKDTQLFTIKNTVAQTRTLMQNINKELTDLYLLLISIPTQEELSQLKTQITPLEKAFTELETQVKKLTEKLYSETAKKEIEALSTRANELSLNAITIQDNLQKEKNELSLKVITIEENLQKEKNVATSKLNFEKQVAIERKKTIIKTTIGLFAVATICYLLTKSEQTNLVSSTIAHFWEKLCILASASVRFVH